MVASILYTIVGAIIGGLVTFYFTRKVSYDTFFLFLGCLRNESFGYIIVINKLLF